jgi:hypothetical protein
VPAWPIDRVRECRRYGRYGRANDAPSGDPRVGTRVSGKKRRPFSAEPVDSGSQTGEKSSGGRESQNLPRGLGAARSGVRRRCGAAGLRCTMRGFFGTGANGRVVHNGSFSARARESLQGTRHRLVRVRYDSGGGTNRGGRRGRRHHRSGLRGRRAPRLVRPRSCRTARRGPFRVSAAPRGPYRLADHCRGRNR